MLQVWLRKAVECTWEGQVSARKAWFGLIAMAARLEGGSGDDISASISRCIRRRGLYASFGPAATEKALSPPVRSNLLHTKGPGVVCSG